MYADIDVKHMDVSADEIADISKALKQFEEELVTVSAELYFEKDFSEQLSRLKNVRQSLSDDRYRLSAVSQVLKNIAGICKRTEESIEESFECLRHTYTAVNVGSYDYSDVGERTERVLYGDASESCISDGR